MACKRSWHWPPHPVVGFQWTASLKSPQRGICRKPHPYFLEAEDDYDIICMRQSCSINILIFPLLTNYLELFGFMIRGWSFVGSYLTKRHYTSFDKCIQETSRKLLNKSQAADRNKETNNNYELYDSGPDTHFTRSLVNVVFWISMACAPMKISTISQIGH